jgi:hypothetical protein
MTDQPTDPTDTAEPEGNEQTPQPITVANLEIVAEELAAYIDRRLQQEIAPKLDALVKAVSKSPADEIVPAIDALLQAIKAPKMLVFDDKGAPIGVKIDDGAS